MRLSAVSRAAARCHAIVRLAAGPDDLADLPPPLRAALAERLRHAPVAVLPALGHDRHALSAVVRPPRWDDAVEVRRRGGALARALSAERCASAALVAPAMVEADAFVPFLVGLGQGAYAWDRYQAKPAQRLAEVQVESAKPAAWAPVLARAAADGAALAACRDLVNLPAEDLGPDEFEAAARAAAKAAGLRLKVIDERAATRLGMGCLLAVGRASPRRPRMLVLELAGRDRRAAPLALCGKGVCFDTGGLNLKTAEGMLLMRKDMGGAATVLHALAAAAARGRPQRTVRAYLPLVENAIGSRAFRPGDVLRALDGTTVEIGNTDAEGRLILADAIALARREGAGAVVTVATLTGAAMTALGRVHVPLMGTDDALCARLLAAAAVTGEKLWRLPLDHEHMAMVKGQVAQLNNAPAGGEAGCITAGAFLAHFAGTTPFAHLDISPASWMPRAWELGPAGATGTALTTIAELACG
jgi:leucyl aminopeptidase